MTNAVVLLMRLTSEVRLLNSNQRGDDALESQDSLAAVLYYHVLVK